ncbi:MAG: hypothetical protein R3F49_05155 [Planctomycetota bacterium]
MPTLLPRAALAVVAATALVTPTVAQQRLFVLDSARQIWRVDGHTTTSATLAPIVTVATPAGANVRGLAYDPTLQHFYVLAGTSTGAVILEVDPVLGTTVTRCTLAGPLFNSLDRRADGVLVMERALNELVLVDPTTCVEWRMPLNASLALHSSNASVAVERHGLVATMSPDGTAYTIDPLDGQTFAPPLSIAFTAHAYEAAANGDFYVASIPWTLYRVAASPAQLWQVVVSNPPAGATIAGMCLEEPADGVGVAQVCAGAVNSTGRSSTLEVIGLPIVGGELMELRCRDLPLHSTGYFLMGRNAGAMPVAAGVLCIAAPVLRNSLDVLDSGSTGTVRRAFTTAQLPVGLAPQAGDVFVFQYWHRDVGGTANFSAARAVTFR